MVLKIKFPPTGGNFILASALRRLSLLGGLSLGCLFDRLLSDLLSLFCHVNAPPFFFSRRARLDRVSRARDRCTLK